MERCQEIVFQLLPDGCLLEHEVYRNNTWCPKFISRNRRSLEAQLPSWRSFNDVESESR